MSCFCLYSSNWLRNEHLFNLITGSLIWQMDFSESSKHLKSMFLNLMILLSLWMRCMCVYGGIKWSHLSVRCGHWFRQVLSLCIELQQWCEVFAPHSVIHMVRFRVFFWEDVAAVCVLRYNVLLPRCPEMHKQKQNTFKTRLSYW